VEVQVNGLLVPSGDVSAFAAALRALSTDEDLRSRLSMGARATSGRFAREPVFEAIEKVLEEVSSE
jgi:glycosyltransferase involved in cell wall biosynthesis